MSANKIINPEELKSGGWEGIWKNGLQPGQVRCATRATSKLQMIPRTLNAMFSVELASEFPAEAVTFLQACGCSAAEI